MRQDLDKLYDMIHGMDTAIMVTRRPDGHLVSRAMSNQHRAPGADLWFVTSAGTGKLDEIESDPHVNITYSKGGSREWLSIAGLARISRDRGLIESLYSKDWKTWFPARDGDTRYGTIDDPRIVLVGVDIYSAVHFDKDDWQPCVLFETTKGWFEGTEEGRDRPYDDRLREDRELVRERRERLREEGELDEVHAGREVPRDRFDEERRR